MLLPDPGSLSLLAQEWITSAGHGSTRLHPVGMAAGGIAGITLLLVPRRWAFLPIIALACFVSPAQRLAVAGVDLYLMRILALLGLLRIASRGEAGDVRWGLLDCVMLCLAVSSALVFTIQQGNPAALVTRIGALTESVAIYLVFRCTVRDPSDVLRVGWSLALLAIPTAMFFLVEKATGRNIFSVLGGAPPVTVVRQGRLRCQGPFPHAIMAGVFWAAAMPFVTMLLLKPGTMRLAGIAGLFAILAIVGATSSSTPASMVILFAIAVVAWYLRDMMNYIRYGLVFALIFLHFAMNAPVWFLIARIDLVGGSTGWHRAHLIDKAVQHLPEWFLFGTRSTAHWGWGLQDVTNQYILEGVRGGFLSFVLFSTSVILAFVYAGRARRNARGNPVLEKVAWLSGCAIFLNACAFISVSYFGQPIQMWVLSLAVVAALETSISPARGAAPAAVARSPGGTGPRAGAIAR